MVIISSFRPFGESPEWATNQLRAFNSWLALNPLRVFLFGTAPAEFASSKVKIVPSEEYPRIKDMVELAAQQRDTSLICNGDIVLGHGLLKISAKLSVRHACCASSRRWHFKPGEGGTIGEASLTDQDGRDDRGRDVFMAKQHVWQTISHEIPDTFRIGNSCWDAYLTDSFRRHWNDKFLDFTGFRLVFHPHHGGRRRPYDEEIAKAINA